MSEKFEDMVMMLEKDGQTILDNLTVEKIRLWHSATGVSGEAGELLDLIKKHVIYGKPLDRTHLLAELGDTFHYFTMMLCQLDISIEEVEEANREKLSERYPNLKYSDDRAIDQGEKSEHHGV